MPVDPARAGTEGATLPYVRIPASVHRRRAGDATLAGRLLVLQALVVLVVVLTSAAVAYIEARQSAQRSAEQRTTAIVESLTNSPLVVDAVTGGNPTAVLQPYVERIRAATGTSFITVLAPDRTRFTHPDPAEIGRPFRGTIAPALAGRTFTETYTGTLGPSVRTTGPVSDGDGHVVALVSAGITVDPIGRDPAGGLPRIRATGRGHPRRHDRPRPGRRPPRHRRHGPGGARRRRRGQLGAQPPAAPADPRPVAGGAGADGRLPPGRPARGPRGAAAGGRRRARAAGQRRGPPAARDRGR